MATNSFTRFKGLRTFPNYLSQNSGEFFKTASNVVIDKEDTIEPRRGIKELITLPDYAKQLLNYKDKVLAHYNSNISYINNDALTTFKSVQNFSVAASTTNITIQDHGFSIGDAIFFSKKRDYSVTTSVVYFPLPSGIDDITTYYILNVIDSNTFQISLSPVGTAITVGAGQARVIGDFVLNSVKEGLRVKSVEMNGSLFVTAKDGIKKFESLDAYSGSAAGGIPALNVDLALDFSGAGGFFGPTTIAPTNVEVSYRWVWGKKDTNNVLILGKPSERATIQNYTGTNAQVVVSSAVPAGINTTYFYQVYRTSVFGIDQSGDEMRLVIEADYDGFSSIVTVTDNTPDGIRDTGTPLYTNEYSGEGIFQSNDKPPVSEDIAIYKNRVWYANTKTEQKLSLTFLGFDGVDTGTNASNLVVTGTNPITITFPSAHNISNNDYVALVNTTSVDGQYQVTVLNSTQIRVAVNFSGLGSDFVLYKSYITTQKSSQINRYFFVGRPEITKLNNSSKAGYAIGDYFNITTINDKIKYSFYLDTTGSDPIVSVSGRIVKAIDISTVTTQAEVRDKIKEAIEATGDFTCLFGGAGETFITTATSGAVTDPVSATEVGTSFTILKTQDGFGEDYAKGFIRLSSYASPALAIEDTAKSIVRVISFTTNSPIYAYYVNTSTSLPGQFYLEEKTFSLTPFTVKANTPALSSMFNPSLLTTGVSSTNSIGNNVLMFSKTQQPDAVPIVNSLKIGPQDKAIKRILGLRDSLFILKEEGIYRLTGENESNFNVALFDNSATIVAPDTAVILNNQIYCLTTQGIATISETGVGIISRPVEDIFIKITSSKFTSTDVASFGVSYEADRSYLIFIPVLTGDTTAKIVYRYNTFTQSWTSFDISATCGIVNIKNKLHLGADDITSVLVERKELSHRDYVDREYTRQISAVSGKKVYIDSASNIEIGDSLTQRQYLTINDVNSLISKLKLDPTLNFPTNYSLVPLTGGPDLSNALLNLIIQLNISDTSLIASSFNSLSDVSSNTITITNHGLLSGDIISLSGSIPQNITSGNYRIVDATTNNFKLQELNPVPITSGYGIGNLTRISDSASLTFNMNSDVNNNFITANGHPFVNGDLLTFTTSQTAPTGMVSGMQYLVKNATTNTFQVLEYFVAITPALSSGIANINEIYYYNGSQDSEDMQSGFNDVINTLNTSDACFFANYSSSSGYEDLDLLIESVNVSQNYVTLKNNSDFYVGNITHYKSIKSEVITDYYTFGNPALLKHVRSGSVMLENNSMNNLTLGYASDLSGNFENDTFPLDGNGDFGVADFGETAFGGDGTAWPLRTIIPRQKQRCRYLKLRIYHSSAFIKYAILGYSFDYEVTSDRGYRNK